LVFRVHINEQLIDFFALSLIGFLEPITTVQHHSVAEGELPDVVGPREVCRLFSALYLRFRSRMAFVQVLIAPCGSESVFADDE